ncbi:MAG: lipopolysaccharide transport periplasmic protein LptA [Legionellaceae bacterium]|nr:lipopolysaccharide transport periplasmic protein LptA [Legionellaceae bacterium]
MIWQTPLVYALPQDAKEMANLQADTVDLDAQSYHGTYRGHVQFSQGSAHLESQSLETIMSPKKELIKAIALGNAAVPAHFWALTELDKPPLHAYASTITYYMHPRRILLEGNVSIQQGDTQLSAEKVLYNIEAQRLQTFPPKSATPTHIVFRTGSEISSKSGLVP